jgi:hypothetical protein
MAEPSVITSKVSSMQDQIFRERIRKYNQIDGNNLEGDDSEQKRWSSGKKCKGRSICEHGKKLTQCKECGGGSICEHQRQRSQCKECGGASICEHQRQRSQCKECGRGSICEHQRRRSRCKECGGGSICEHQRRRSECKECGGASNRKQQSEVKVKGVRRVIDLSTSEEAITLQEVLRVVNL